MTSSGTRVVLAALVALLCTWGGAEVVAAHGDEADMELLASEVRRVEGDAHRVDLTVSIRHPEDQHLALDAEVAVVGSHHSGVALLPEPLELTDEPGRYAGSIELAGDPGPWQLAVVSSGPDARLDLRVDPEEGTVAVVSATTTPGTHEESAWERLRWLALGCGIALALAAFTLLRRRARSVRTPV